MHLLMVAGRSLCWNTLALYVGLGLAIAACLAFATLRYLVPMLAASWAASSCVCLSHLVKCCRFDNGQVSVSLRQGECELRKQALMEPKLGWPPVLISKGPLVSFTAGAPLSAAAPAVPGYSRVLGSSLWGQQGFECANSLRCVDCR